MRTSRQVLKSLSNGSPLGPVEATDPGPPRAVSREDVDVSQIEPLVTWGIGGKARRSKARLDGRSSTFGPPTPRGFVFCESVWGAGEVLDLVFQGIHPQASPNDASNSNKSFTPTTPSASRSSMQSGVPTVGNSQVPSSTVASGMKFRAESYVQPKQL